MEVVAYRKNLQLILITLATLALTALFWFVHLHPTGKAKDSSDMMMVFGVIFCSAMSVILIGCLLYNLISRPPAIIICADKVIAYSNFGREIFKAYYKDIDHFELTKVMNNDFISVYYKEHVKLFKIQQSSFLKKRLYSSNQNYTGTIESIPASSLSINGAELCNIMNEYLHNYNESNL